MNEKSGGEVQKQPPLVLIAPLEFPFAKIAEECCKAGGARFSNFAVPKITKAGPVTTLDFGDDGIVEVIDRDAPLPEQALINHQAIRKELSGATRHALFITKPSGNEVMDRAIGGLSLLVLGWAFTRATTSKYLYWASSDQWADAKSWAELTIPAAEELKLPVPLWVKILVDQSPGAEKLDTLGLQPLVGYELTWPLGAITRDAVQQLSSLISYVLNPNTPVPQAGQTFGGGTTPEFKLSAIEGTSKPTLAITQVGHGLVH